MESLSEAESYTVSLTFSQLQRSAVHTNTATSGKICYAFFWNNCLFIVFCVPVYVWVSVCHNTYVDGRRRGFRKLNSDFLVCVACDLCASPSLRTSALNFIDTKNQTQVLMFILQLIYSPSHLFKCQKFILNKSKWLILVQAEVQIEQME